MPDLDEYQIKAIHKLKTGSVLCGGTGSGKTRTSLAYYKWIVCKDDYILLSLTPLYVITTAKKRDGRDWNVEAAMFDIEEDGITVDSWNNIGKYIDVENAFFIFDEQRVVGRGAWVKSFLKIAKKNDWILLSATPGDKYEDYIPLMLANGFYRTRTEFCREHIVYKMGPTYPVIDRYLNTGKLNYYIRKIIVQLPYDAHTERIFINVKCSYDKDLYKKTTTDSWNYIDNVPIDTAADYCYQLRRIVNSDENRLENLIVLLKENNKCIVFYSYDYELFLITSWLDKNGLNYSQWNGHKHEDILYDEEQWCYLVQYTAGAEGWNCIETNIIIFYSLQYSYKVFEQSCGRIDRRNTPYQKLYYYILKSNSSIDMRINQALLNKQDFNYKLFKEG